MDWVDEVLMLLGKPGGTLVDFFKFPRYNRAHSLREKFL
jgi:hypothetical protein